MAQGIDPFYAAAMASWIHGDAALRAGPGLIAADLEAWMPSVIRDLHGAR